MNIKIFFTSILLLTIALGGHAQSGPSFVPDVIYVKMKDDLGYKVTDKQLKALRPDKQTPEVLEQLTALGWWSRVHNIPDERLQQWRIAAGKNLRETLPDPRAEFLFHLYLKEKMQEATGLLQQLQDVGEILRIPVPVKAPVPDFSAQQVYKGTTAPGINADSVWLVYHNRGGGIKVCDIEYSFNTTHMDLPPVTILGNTPVDPFGGDGVMHGTAVMGEILSKNNGEGTTGIATDCSPYFSGAFTAENGYNMSLAITNAMDSLGTGDVILLEQQIGGPNEDTLNPSTQVGLVPVEWFKPYYDAIKLAVGKGISVVEAAGNGQQDLDDPVYNTGNGGHHPFLAANNSGAIIVGAGGVGSGAGGAEVARGRLWFSNYGSRVDLQGNGEAVITTGYGDLYNSEGADKYFTAQFGGTSSASPIVTGAVILLQSVYKDSANGNVLTPAQVRDVLKATGKAQTNGTYPSAMYKIGPLPNVCAAIRSALTITAITPVNKETAFELYPNPNRGKVTLSFPDARPSDYKIQVCSSTGAVIRNYKAGRAGSNKLEIDLGDMAPGIYWLRMVSGSNSTVKKIIVTR